MFLLSSIERELPTLLFDGKLSSRIQGAKQRRVFLHGNIKGDKKAIASAKAPPLMKQKKAGPKKVRRV